MPDESTATGNGMRPYKLGLVFALVLTAIPFALVATGLLSRTATLAAIIIAALVQVLVHLRYFLHVDLRSTPRENLVALLFAAVLIFLMVGGTLWIMTDLHDRMVG